MSSRQNKSDNTTAKMTKEIVLYGIRGCGQKLDEKHRAQDFADTPADPSRRENVCSAFLDTKPYEISLGSKAYSYDAEDAPASAIRTVDGGRDRNLTCAGSHQACLEGAVLHQGRQQRMRGGAAKKANPLPGRTGSTRNSGPEFRRTGTAPLHSRRSRAGAACHVLQVPGHDGAPAVREEAAA